MKETGDLLVGLPYTADNHCAARASSAPVLSAVLQDLHSSLQDCGLQDLGNLDKDLAVSLDIESACLGRSVDVGENSVLEGKPSEDCTALHTLLCLGRPLGSRLFLGLVAFLEAPFPHVKNATSLGADEGVEDLDPLRLVA